MNRVTWHIGELDPGDMIIISVQVNITDDIEYDGIITSNNVYVNWTDEENNLYGPVSDFHLVQLFVNPYIEVEKSAPPESPPGEQLVFTIKLKNPTNSALSGIELIDYLPARVSYLSCTRNGTYNESLNTITWRDINIGSGETLEFQIEVLIDEDLVNGSTIINMVIASWSTGSDVDVSYTLITKPIEPTPTITETTPSPLTRLQRSRG